MSANFGRVGGVRSRQPGTATLRRGVGALLVAGALAAGCGGDGTSGGAEAAGPPRLGDTVPTLRTTADGQERPWFAAPTLEGDTVTVADLRGSPVLLNLWATWCPPCRAETPYLQSVHARYDGRLRTVGVTVDNRGAADQVRDFVGEAGVTYEILHDPTMRAMDLFGVPGLPGTFLLDRDGVVTFVRIGPVMEGDPAFEAALADLLGPPPDDAGTEEGAP